MVEPCFAIVMKISPGELSSYTPDCEISLMPGDGKMMGMARRFVGRRRRNGRTGSDLVLPIPARSSADSATSDRVASF